MIADGKFGDILESIDPVLVNPVNCVGTMGKGLAAKFRERFPENYEAYAEHCAAGMLHPGEIFVYGENPVIINAATKDHWKDGSKAEWIASIVAELHRFMRHNPRYDAISVPALGCGYGDLDWKAMYRLFYDPVAEHIVEKPAKAMFHIYEPLNVWTINWRLDDPTFSIINSWDLWTIFTKWWRDGDLLNSKGWRNVLTDMYVQFLLRIRVASPHTFFLARQECFDWIGTTAEELDNAWKKTGYADRNGYHWLAPITFGPFNMGKKRIV